MRPGDTRGAALIFERLIWLVPALVLCAGAWRPRAAVLVLTACLPLFGSPPGGPYLAALDVAGLAAIVTALRARRPLRTPIDRPALAVVVVSAASLVPLAYHPPSWHPQVLLGLLQTFPYVQHWSVEFTWRALANLILGWALFVTVRRTFRRDTLWQLGVALACGLVPLVGLGLLDYAELLSLRAYRPIGLPLYDARLHSLFFHSGWLAEYLVIATPVAIAGLWLHGPVAKRGGVALLALTLPTILFTQQRGGWFAAVTQLLALGGVAAWRVWHGWSGGRRWIHRRSLAAIAAGGAVAVVIGGGVLASNSDTIGPLAERLEDAGDDLSGRAAVWSAAAAMSRERPVLGWGLGSFAPVFDEAGFAPTRWHVGRWLTAHNLPLSLTAERGLLGLAAFALLASMLGLSLRRGLTASDAGSRTLAVGLLVSWIGFLLYGAVQDLFFIRSIEWLTWILLGATGLLAAGESRRWPNRLAWSAMVLAALLVPWRIAAVTPPPPKGDRAYGIHAWEREANGRRHRWTESRAALRLRRGRGDLVLDLANGHPRVAEHPVTVELGVDGRDLRTVRLAGDEWVRVRIPASSLPDRTFTLRLSAHPSFRPFQAGLNATSGEASRDIRRLGVAMRSPQWAGPPPTAAPRSIGTAASKE